MVWDMIICRKVWNDKNIVEIAARKASKEKLICNKMTKCITREFPSENKMSNNHAFLKYHCKKQQKKRLVKEQDLQHWNSNFNRILIDLILNVSECC